MTTLGFPASLRQIAVCAIVFMIGSSGCSDSADTQSLHESSRNRQRVSDMIGEHIYLCNEDTQVDVDFLADGLAINLRFLPDGLPISLSAPATGLTYVGDNINLNIRQNEINITRPNAASLSCRRIKRANALKRDHPP